LLTPGSSLNKRWCEQVDELAATLRELQKQGVAVLWNPLPEGNGGNYWWAGRKGIHGSAELYRQLFDRLVNHDGVHNLLWVWEADASESKPPSQPGSEATLSDFFPGLLYVDAPEARVSREPDFTSIGLLRRIAVGKATGIELADLDVLPPAGALRMLADWAWFLVGAPSAAPADPAARAEALRKLYADPRIVSLVPAQ